MKKEHIAFIIEDNKIEVSIIKKIIKSNKSIANSKFNINGLLALEKLQQLHTSHQKLPTFILLDFNMPIMNGLEFLEKIKDLEEINKIPIFMNTSYVERDKLHVFNEYENVKGSFAKPFSEQSLHTILEYFEIN